MRRISTQAPQLAVGDAQGIVRFFELPSGQELRQFAFDRAVSVVKFSPDGSCLAVGGMVGPLEVRDAVTGEVSFQGPPLRTYAVAWRPDARWVAVAAASEVHLLEIRQQGGCHLVCRGHQSTVINVDFHPQGQLVASTAWDETIRVWDAGSGHQLLRERGSLIRCGSDGRLLAGLQGLDLCLWEVSTPDADRWLHTGMTRATAVMSNGNLLVTGHDDGVRIWHLGTKGQIGYLPIGAITDVACHPVDGSLLTSGSTGLHRWPVSAEVSDSCERVLPRAARAD